MLNFSIIRARAPTGGPDDLLIWATIPPITSFPPGILVLPDQDITLDETLDNLSTLGSLRVTTGDDFDILLDDPLENASDVNSTDDLEVQESPPDESLYPTQISSTSLVNDTEDLEVAEAPPDEYIYPTRVESVSDVNPTDDLEVQEVSPYDVDLGAPMITNVSLVNDTTDLTVESEAVDDDPVAGAHLSGGTTS